MASEAISSSIMIIGAVLGAAVLITAILPAIFSAGDTFGTVSSSAEQKLKTDFQFINTYAKDNNPATDTLIIWLKNTGANRISEYEIQHSDIFYVISNGQPNDVSYNGGSGFSYTGLTSGYWTIGNTLKLIVTTPANFSSTDTISLTFAVPNGVKRTITFSPVAI